MRSSAGQAGCVVADTPPAGDADAPATVLIVDDDALIREGLGRGLGRRGYRTLMAASAGEMDRLLARQQVDVVILDVMMSGEDGLSACRRLAGAVAPPVILLSALGEEQDRIVGLEAGADRYLPKPCSVQEVIAHVRAALRGRRLARSVRTTLVFQGWRVDLASNEVFDPQGVLILLTDGEFAMLRVFVERSRRVLSRDELLQAARGTDSSAFDRAVDIQVSRLRRKLGAPGNSLIRTVRNEGYLFAAKVSVEPETP